MAVQALTWLAGILVDQQLLVTLLHVLAQLFSNTKPQLLAQSTSITSTLHTCNALLLKACNSTVENLGAQPQETTKVVDSKPIGTTCIDKRTSWCVSSQQVKAGICLCCYMLLVTA